MHAHTHTHQRKAAGSNTNGHLFLPLYCECEEVTCVNVHRFLFVLFVQRELEVKVKNGLQFWRKKRLTRSRFLFLLCFRFTSRRLTHGRRTCSALSHHPRLTDPKTQSGGLHCTTLTGYYLYFWADLLMDLGQEKCEFLLLKLKENDFTWGGGTRNNKK